MKTTAILVVRRTLAAVLCGALMATGCASAGGPRVAASPQIQALDPAVLSEYVQRLPAGSRVRVERTDGTAVHGTLMGATSDAITVQTNTRVPEPPVNVPLAAISRVTVDHGGSSVGKSVAIGIASGVGAFFGIVLLVIASIGD